MTATPGLLAWEHPGGEATRLPVDDVEELPSGGVHAYNTLPDEPDVRASLKVALGPATPWEFVPEEQ